MFLSLIRIVPIPEKRDKILEMLDSVARHAKLIHGCTGGTVCEESEQRERDPLPGELGDREKRCNAMFDPACTSGVLHAMDLASEPPEISFYEISGEKGLELIREFREPEEEAVADARVTEHGAEGSKSYICYQN